MKKLLKLTVVAIIILCTMLMFASCSLVENLNDGALGEMVESLNDGVLGKIFGNFGGNIAEKAHENLLDEYGTVDVEIDRADNPEAAEELFYDLQWDADLNDCGVKLKSAAYYEGEGDQWWTIIIYECENEDMANALKNNLLAMDFDEDMPCYHVEENVVFNASEQSVIDVALGK